MDSGESETPRSTVWAIWKAGGGEEGSVIDFVSRCLGFRVVVCEQDRIMMYLKTEDEKGRKVLPGERTGLSLCLFPKADERNRHRLYLRDFVSNTTRETGITTHVTRTSPGSEARHGRIKMSIAHRLAKRREANE